jgi:aminoglycoside phosphotransferase family enzyme/predicted kinase
MNQDAAAVDIAHRPVDGPAVTETHCATVFFVGDRAYKVKKALDLGFVDFRTPESRQLACHREVELNRRFAPDVYLGVAEVRPEDGPPCDWVVMMRRMPADRRLSALVSGSEDVSDSLRSVARLLAIHHCSARRSTAIDAQGTPAALRRRWTDNLDALQEFRDSVIDPDLLDEIQDRALRYVEGRHPLLEARIAAGRIRDGHGDLLTDDIFCLPDGPRVLDCLEFDGALRAVDGLDDAACLAMDLERLGAAGLAERFLDWFSEFSGESRVDSLIHHYIAYRAVVRLKVACLRWAQGDDVSADSAQRLAELAIAHLRRAEPRLILVGGSPGTGKSTVAGGLADRFGGVLLRSDRLRKERAGLALEQHAGEPWRVGLYAPAISEATYDDMISRAVRLLGHGETVVLDASWSDIALRRRARDAAAAFSLVSELRCCAPVEVVDDRIERRRETADPSDATPELARLMERTFEVWPEATELSTVASLPVTLDRATRLVTHP